MTRKPATNTRTRAAKPKATAAATKDQAASETGAAANTEIPAANGVEAKPEGAAASDDGTEAKASEASGADAADPNGTDSAPAAQVEESREQAEAASADRKDAAEEGKQPEETALPPVAGDPESSEDAVLVVTGPKSGRRRSGFRFSREPRELRRADFGDLIDAEGARLIVAIVADPALKCVMRLPDGTEFPLDAETNAAAREVLAALDDDAKSD